MFELTDEYKELAKRFRKTFGYGVPLSMIPTTVSMNDLLTRMANCIEKGEDNLLESFGVPDDENILF